jgi:hypothetical protein
MDCLAICLGSGQATLCQKASQLVENSEFPNKNKGCIIEKESVDIFSSDFVHGLCLIFVLALDLRAI